uniref:Uncharacterized protein n=1 Tax=Hordeum vulgare subsp. vulgare TaxID=112509 RepID=A0A8I6WPF7_HORVV
MVLSVTTSSFTFIAPNFWNMAIASSAQLFRQSPLSIRATPVRRPISFAAVRLGRPGHKSRPNAPTQTDARPLGVRLTTHSPSNFGPDLRRRGHETYARARAYSSPRARPPVASTAISPQNPPARARSRPAPAMDGDLDLDLDAATGLASLASDKGKPRASRKTAAPKPKKVLTAEQRAKESTKRKDWRHAAGVRDEAIAAATAQQQITNARVAAATREALCMLGLNPSQHGLFNAAAVSTGSSAFPRALLPDSPRASSCNPVPGFHVYPQASCLLGECSSEVSVVAPSTPAPTTIDLNATPVAGGSSSGGATKRARQTPADQLPGARNLFDGMPAAGNDDYMQNMIFEGGAQSAGFNPGETQSQDGRGYNED